MGLLGNPWLLWALFVFFWLWSFVCGSRLRRNGQLLRKPPGTWPVVGNGIVFLRERQKLFAWFSRCERLYGYETLQISVPTLPPGVIINDPRNLDYVFKNEGIFSKGEFVKKRSWDLFGNGIINADGDLWKIQRKAGLQFLNTANLKTLTQVALPRYLAQSVESLRDSPPGQTVDMQAVFHEITTQLMGNMAYNMEMHADDEFTVAFDYASGATARRFQNPLWFVSEALFGCRFRQSLSVVKSHGRDIVARALKDRNDCSTGIAGDATDEPDKHRPKAAEGSLIQAFLDSIGDEQMVADAALNYLSAGRDTTAQALTWTLYLLMRHPTALDGVRQEVGNYLAGKGMTEASLSEATSKLQDLAVLPFTHAVFNESLRLFPPIPFEIKQTMQTTTLPDGTFLPRDSVVVWCPWAMNRSRVTWGPDSDEFRPERWLVQDRVMNRSAAEFPVFNGGPRTCLGKRMAEIIAVQVLATLALGFDFEAAEEGDRVSKSSLTLPMEGGLPCRVRPRDDQ